MIYPACAHTGARLHEVWRQIHSIWKCSGSGVSRHERAGACHLSARRWRRIPENHVSHLIVENGIDKRLFHIWYSETVNEEITVVHSSGNIFADLDLPEPEELLAKAALGLQIRDAIVERGWTQVQAAAALGIPQPKVSALMGARLSGFSIERLLRLLLRLDRRYRYRRAA